jgi:hypothetical protein
MLNGTSTVFGLSHYSGLLQDDKPTLSQIDTNSNEPGLIPVRVDRQGFKGRLTSGLQTYLEGRELLRTVELLCS